MATLEDAIGTLFDRAGYETPPTGLDHRSVADDLLERALAPPAARVRPLAAPVPLTPQPAPGTAPGDAQPRPATFGEGDKVFGQGDEVVEPARSKSTQKLLDF